MAETFNKMKIDVNEEINDIITEVQGDQNSRYLDVYLYENGVPIDLTDHTVRIYMCRPETDPLEEIFNDGEITDATAGRCQFLLTTQALAKTGYLEMQITIWKGTEQILSTHAFKIMVTKSLMSDGSVEASNEYGALVVLFQNLYEAMDLMTEMVQNIGVPAEVAAQYDLTTMWQAWEFLVAYMKGDLTDKIDEAIENASVQGVLDVLENKADQDTLEKLYNLSFSNFDKVDLSKLKVAVSTVSVSSSKANKTFTFTGKKRIHGIGIIYSGSYSTYSYRAVTLTIDGTTYDFTTSDTSTIGVAAVNNGQSVLMYDSSFSILYNKPVLSFMGSDSTRNISLSIYPIDCEESISVTVPLSNAGSGGVNVLMGVVFEEL